MTINNERLAKFEGKCWHKWNIAQYCKVCGVSRHGNDNPFYSTSPDDRERLWGYLMGKEEMWRYFQDWTYDVWEEDVDLVERGTSWNTEADRAAWLHKPLDGTPRWVSLLSDWLGMESTREKFGMIKCPNCVAGVEESNVTIIKECTVCNGSGKIRAEWAKEE
jgi:hypothetical protein